MIEFLELIIGLYILVKLCCVIEDQDGITFISLLSTVGSIITVVFIMLITLQLVVIFFFKPIAELIDCYFFNHFNPSSADSNLAES